MRSSKSATVSKSSRVFVFPRRSQYFHVPSMVSTQPLCDILLVSHCPAISQTLFCVVLLVHFLHNIQVVGLLRSVSPASFRRICPCDFYTCRMLATPSSGAYLASNSSSIPPHLTRAYLHSHLALHCPHALLVPFPQFCVCRRDRVTDGSRVVAHGAELRDPVMQRRGLEVDRPG